MKVQDNILKDTGRLVFWYPIRWLARLFPFRLVRLLGRATGYLDYYLFKGRSQKIQRNLLYALGDQLSEQAGSKMVRKILGNHYTLILEFFKYPQINENNLKSIVDIQGIRHLEDALKGGRGAIIGHLHFGAKFLLIIALGLKRYPINQIAYHMPKEKLTFIREKVSLKQRVKIEESFKVRYIYPSKTTRPAFACLKDNEVLMVAADGKGELTVPYKGSVPVKFLGQITYFPAGIAAFSKRKKIPVLPGAVFRQENGKYKLVIGPSIDIDYEKQAHEFRKEVISKLIKVLEHDIRQYPDQWEYWEEFTAAGIMDNVT